MKADLPLAERQRREAEDWQAMRAALVGRHVEVLDQHYAIEAAQIALDVRTAPVFRELAGRFRG
ncbi:MAG: hypothetical protein QM690_01455 [Sphingobium sp.]